VLGSFLGIGEEFGGVPFVLLWSDSTRARSSDRANLHRVADQPDMHLRRTSHKRKVRSEFKTKHVRRRIDETKASIEIERVPAEIRFESLRQNNLEDITRANVLLGSFDCALELARLKIAAVGTSRCDVRTGRRAVPTNGLHFGICRWNKRKIGRFRKLPHDLVN
jgi:hypothetical protein